MKTLLFSLSGLFAFALGVMANLELVLPDSVLHAAEPGLPFEVEYIRLEEAHAMEGYWAEGVYYLVTLRIRNVSSEERVFPMGSVIITDGQAETISLDFEVLLAMRAKQGPRFWAPDEVREIKLCFDVPVRFPHAQLELEAAAFSSPELMQPLGRRVLADNLSF